MIGGMLRLGSKFVRGIVGAKKGMATGTAVGKGVGALVRSPYIKYPAIGFGGATLVGAMAQQIRGAGQAVGVIPITPQESAQQWNKVMEEKLTLAQKTMDFMTQNRVDPTQNPTGMTADALLPYLLLNSQQSETPVGKPTIGEQLSGMIIPILIIGGIAVAIMYFKK